MDVLWSATFPLRWAWYKCRYYYCLLHERTRDGHWYGCGHFCTRIVTVLHEGRKIIGIVGKKELNWCFPCIVAAAIKCTWCKSLILPGHYVTLTTPTDEDMVREHAQWENDHLIGCMHCAPRCERSVIEWKWDITRRVIPAVSVDQ